MNKLEQSYIIHKDQHYETILSQVDQLDRQNKKLISIADNILKTSFLRPTEQKPAIIVQFEQDMRGSFNALIDSIREFFINIDEKIERIGSIVQSKFEEHDLEKSKYPTKKPNSESDKIEILMSRMTLLEQNLKKTQENEGKLISIIEAMTSKRNLYDEEPTMVRSREQNFNFAKEEPKVGKAHETSFRLFSVPDIHGNIGNQLNKYQPDYTTPYQMVNSQFSDRQKTLDRQQTFKFNNLCMPQKQESKHPINDNFLINRKTFQMENSNRIHRLSTLMKALKQ